jgi:endonuclease/exonuclease/phosphatase family metal-dependent hydrolase
MGDGYSSFQVTAQRRRGVDQGNGLVWRRGTFEPGSPEVVPLDTLVAKMSIAERTLLRAVPPQRRIAIRAESAQLRVYVVHLDVIGFAHKLEQLKAVITDMDVRPHAPLTVVAGDLNTFGPPGLQLWRKLDAAAKGARLVDVTRRIRRTHWTSQKLDAIFIRSDMPVRHRSWTLPLKASDHQPVFADIDLESHAG